MNAQTDPDLPVEIEAARLAIEWKDLFARELQSEAQRLAIGDERVSVDHYRRALAIAIDRIQRTIPMQWDEAPDVRRRTA